MSESPDGFESLDQVAEAIHRYNPHRPSCTSHKGLLKNVRQVSTDGGAGTGTRPYSGLPHAQHASVADAGHMVAGDDNDVFTTCVSEFLEAAASNGII
ncbi:hypothetical protein [Nocardia sp. NPDC059239]|uniref:hypothetical protein n=1 Tax=unclassified Nocardia TaxID=2637762 RepID=UPI0036B79E26